MFNILGAGTKRKKKSKVKTKKKRVKKTKLNCFASKGKRFNKTCYSDDELMKLRDLWNTKHPDRKIKTTNSNAIWETLNKYLDGVCDNELCWLERSFVNKDLKSHLTSLRLAPFHTPSWNIEPNKWLDSLDITRVMKQYEKEYPYFMFLGPSPIDFDHRPDDGKCVWEDICNLNICDEYNKQNKRKFGFIFNLDPHYKGGSHWVSLFVDLDKNFIFFLDTNGDSIPDEIKALVKRLKKQCKQVLHKRMSFSDNAPTEHQYENTECGRYSLYALVNLLQEKTTPQTIKRRRIPDEKMMAFRKIFFNDPELKQIE